MVTQAEQLMSDTKDQIAAADQAHYFHVVNANRELFVEGKRIEVAIKPYKLVAQSLLGLIQTEDAAIAKALDQVVAAKSGVTRISENEFWAYLGVPAPAKAALVESTGESERLIQPPPAPQQVEPEPQPATGFAMESKVGVVGLPATTPNIVTSDPIAVEAAIQVGDVKTAPAPAKPKTARRNQHTLP